MMKTSKKKIIFYLTIMMVLLPSVVFSQTTDNKVYEIADKLMCPVCRGQTVSHSNSELANDMRRIIKQKLEEGKSEEEILTYFTNRYGDSVLASPPKKGVNLLLWFLPLTGLVVGFMFLVYYLRTETRYRDTQKEENNIDDVKESELLRRIDKEIDID